MPIYDRPVRLLMRDMVEAVAPNGVQQFQKDDAIAWFATHYPKIKEGTIAAHLIRFSINAPISAFNPTTPMPNIGKSLVFFLKYEDEMGRLFDETGEIPEIEKRSDREEILKKVNAVGQAAGREAADLLELCLKDLRFDIEKASVARLRFSQRKTIERKRQVNVEVCRRDGKKASIQREIGLFLDRRGVTPWAWSRGGVAIEREIAACLPAGTRWDGSKVFGWTGGSIALKPIPVPWHEADDFDVLADGVIRKTRVALLAFGPRFIKKFIQLGP